jgi:hypothetical protein
MHYVTSRSHRIQKHMFGITCPSALFVETSPVPLEHEKYCVDVSWPGWIGMHYVTRRSRITCPGTIFVELIPVPLDLEK